MKKLAMLAIVTATLTACSQGGPGYGSFVNQQVEQGRGYQFSQGTSDLSGPSNRVLEAAEYRSDIRADTTENMARAQHAELGVVDHKLDTARRAQHYDHLAKTEGNYEKRDLNTIESITGSVSNTGSNIGNAIDNFSNIFK